MQSAALRDLLLHIRQHPAFPELMRSVECPALPRFKPGTPESVETLGSKFLFASGEAAQHDRWLTFLRGNTASQQE